MINSATLQTQKMNANRQIKNTIDNKKTLENAKLTIKQFLLDITSQEALKDLDGKLKVKFFYHILDHNTVLLKKALEEAKLAIPGLTTEDLVGAILYSKNPRLDSSKLFNGYKVFTSTAEQFLFKLFESTDKKTLVKNIVIAIGPSIEQNPIKLRAFINTYMNNVEIAHYNALFFSSMYELGIRQFYNLVFRASLIPGSFSDVEFINCEFGNAHFGFLQNVKFVNCEIRSGTKFQNLQDCLFIKCKLDNVKIDAMTRTAFINCKETYRVVKYRDSLIVEDYYTSRNNYQTLNDITFYREDSDYRGVNTKLEPFIIDQNRQMIKSAISTYSTFKPLIPESIHSSLDGSCCSLTLDQLNDLPDDRAIVIITSNIPILSNKLSYQYFFYTAESFQEYLVRSYQKEGIDSIVVPDNKVKFYISPPKSILDQNQIYYTFYKNELNEN